MDGESPLSWKMVCGRICFFLILAGLVLVIVLLALLTRHYFLPGPTVQNPRFFH